MRKVYQKKRKAQEKSQIIFSYLIDWVSMTYAADARQSNYLSHKGLVVVVWGVVAVVWTKSFRFVAEVVVLALGAAMALLAHRARAVFGQLTPTRTAVE